MQGGSSPTVTMVGLNEIGKGVEKWGGGKGVN